MELAAQLCKQVLSPYLDTFRVQKSINLILSGAEKAW
jgi:hypothetical protein